MLLAQLPAEPSVALPPGFEVPGHHREQPRLLCGLLLFSGANEEARAQIRIPADVVAATHLIPKEACQEKALRAGSLHEITVVRHRRIRDEVIEHRAQVRWRRHLEFSRRGDLRV